MASVLRKKKNVLKQKVTITLCSVDRTDTESMESCLEVLQDCSEQISVIDEKINELCIETEEEELSETYNTDLKERLQYLISVNKEIKVLKSLIVKAGKVKIECGAGVKSNDASDYKLKLPELEVDKFDGEGTSNLEYHSFISQFMNVIGNRTNLNNSTKLTYLKTYLKGYAHKLIQNLQITDENYQMALDLLDKEFLNKEALVDDLFKKLLDLKPDFDRDLTKTKIYISDVRCILTDLKTYGKDLLEDDSANALVSHIVFNRLPNSFKQELVRRLNSNFPSMKEIFDNYSEVVKTLNLKSNRVFDRNDGKSDGKNVNKKGFTRMSNHNNSSPLQQNSNTTDSPGKTEFKKNCKWCQSTSHSMLGCKKYPNHESRVKRCKELGMCLNCTSLKHFKNNCRKLDFACVTCKSQFHISALCPDLSENHSNWCINSSNSSGKTFILPTVKLLIGKGEDMIEIRCLYDTGSQRSYVVLCWID